MMVTKGQGSTLHSRALPKARPLPPHRKKDHVTLDAMHWVWNHSQAKGNTRIALLYVADQVRTPACEARLGYSELAEALNAPRSVTKDAVRKALASGELKLMESGKGTRPSLYRLSGAVGYVRPTASSGPDSGTQAASTPLASGPDSGTQAPNPGVASGPDSGTEWAGFRPSSGPDSGPHSPSPVPSQQERESEGPPDGIPQSVRPLIDGLTNAGVVVRWPFTGREWMAIHSLIERSGVAAMVSHARKVSKRTSVESAKYFLKGWSELPPLPSDAPRPTAVKAEHCGDIDCDPHSRKRSTEDTDGYRYLTPCPDCHPTQQGAPA